MEKHSEVIDFNIQVMLGAVLRHRALPSALRGFCVSADSNRETLCETAKQGMSERVCVCVRKGEVCSVRLHLCPQY